MAVQKVFFFKNIELRAERQLGHIAVQCKVIILAVQALISSRLFE
jgi:hypothetical protein